MVISGTPYYGYNQPVFGLGAAPYGCAFGLPVQFVNHQSYLQAMAATLPLSSGPIHNTGILNRPVYTVNIVYPLIVPVYCQLPLSDLSERNMWSVPDTFTSLPTAEPIIPPAQASDSHLSKPQVPKPDMPDEQRKAPFPLTSHIADEKSLEPADKMIEEKSPEHTEQVGGEKQSEASHETLLMSESLEDALYQAFDKGDNEEVCKLIADKPYKTLVSGDGNNLLSIACQYRNYDMAKVFHEAGISPNQSSNKGYTALHIACEKGSKELVQLLLLNKDGNGNSIEPADSLAAENPEKLTPLHFAAKNNEVILITKLAKDLVNKGRHNQIDTRTADGYTPLMFAADSGQSAVVEKLLKYGADPLLTVLDGDDKDKTAYDFACESAHASNLLNYFTKRVLKKAMKKYAKLQQK